MLKKVIFKDFSEYWYYARNFSKKQKEIIFSSLPKEQQSFIKNSYKKGRWDEVLCRNTIDEILDSLKDKYHLDILSIRNKVLKGKSVYVPTIFWEEIVYEASKFDSKHVEYIVGGIKAEECKKNTDVTLLVKK